MGCKVKVRVKHWLTRQVAEEIIWQQLNIEVSGSNNLRFEPFESEPQYRMDMGYTDIMITEGNKPFVVAIMINTSQGNFIEVYFDCRTWENLGEAVFAGGKLVFDNLRSPSIRKE